MNQTSEKPTVRPDGGLFVVRRSSGKDASLGLIASAEARLRRRTDRLRMNQPACCFAVPLPAFGCLPPAFLPFLPFLIFAPFRFALPLFTVPSR